MGNIFVPVDDELFSTLAIGTPEFPFARFHDNLDNFASGFVNWHKQQQIEISYVIEGSVRACLFDKDFIVKKGEFFLILPDAFHSVQPIDNFPGKYETIIFDPSIIIGFSRSFIEKNLYQPVVNGNQKIYTFSDTLAYPKIFVLLQEIFSTDSVEGQHAKLKLQQELQQLWLLLFETIFETNEPEAVVSQDLRILEMIEYLRKNYQTKYSLSDLAMHMNLSRGECCRYFKKRMRMTISDYLLEYRIGKACELLKNTQKRITEIAHEVGFESASNFSMLFQKKTGKTPKEYRKIREFNIE